MTKYPPAASPAQIAVTVSAIGQAAATPASAAGGSSSGGAAGEPSWAASSALAADNLRRDQHSLQAELLRKTVGLAYVLGGCAVLLLGWSLYEARRSHGFKVTSHWGGFGGSGGGWHLSSALACLLGAGTLALASAMVGASVLQATVADAGNNSSPVAKKTP